MPWLWLATQQSRSQIFQDRPVEEGLGFRFEQDPEAIGHHRLVIFADCGSQPESPACPARFHRSSSQETSNTVAARAGLAVVTGQHLQWVAGETITLASAAKPDHGGTALRITEGRQHIDVQAQHHELRLLASGKLSLASVAEHVDVAAATQVRIATAQGTSITIEGGNITFECPDTITYYTSMRNMGGPTKQPCKLPGFPSDTTRVENTAIVVQHQREVRATLPEFTEQGMHPPRVCKARRAAAREWAACSGRRRAKVSRYAC